MHRSITLITSLVLLATSHPLLAQATSPADQPAPGRAAPRQRPAEVAAPVANTPVFSMNFKGGSVAEYVEAVRQAAGSANVLVMPDANRVDIPPVKLTGVSIGSAIYVLRGRTQQTIDRMVTLNVDEVRGVGAGSDSIFTIDAHIDLMPGRGPRPAADVEYTRVWSLDGLIEGGIKAEDALSAIETSLSLDSEAKTKPEMKYHKDTRLLLARGPLLQLEAIGGVLDSLSNTVAARDSRKGSDQLGARVKGIEQRLDALTKRLEDMAAKPR